MIITQFDETHSSYEKNLLIFFHEYGTLRKHVRVINKSEIGFSLLCDQYALLYDVKNEKWYLRNDFERGA